MILAHKSWYAERNNPIKQIDQTIGYFISLEFLNVAFERTYPIYVIKLMLKTHPCISYSLTNWSIGDTNMILDQLF